jgi:hypothetical protein
MQSDRLVSLSKTKSSSKHFKNHCPQKTTNALTPPPTKKIAIFWGGGEVVNFFSERGFNFEPENFY